MKKLNQTELRVLAKRINDDLNRAGKQAQKELDELNDKQNLTEARLAVRQLKKLGPAAKKFINKSLRTKLDDITEERILLSMRTEQTKVICGYNVHNDIVNALILAQITSPDIDSLCNTVAKQFISTP